MLRAVSVQYPYMQQLDSCTRIPNCTAENEPRQLPGCHWSVYMSMIRRYWQSVIGPVRCFCDVTMILINGDVCTISASANHEAITVKFDVTLELLKPSCTLYSSASALIIIACSWSIVRSSIYRPRVDLTVKSQRRRFLYRIY